MEKLYKVVSVDKGSFGQSTLKSAVAKGAAQLTYSPYAITVAKVGGILVFTALESALEFIQNECSLRHWELWRVTGLSEIKLSGFTGLVFQLFEEDSYVIDMIKEAWSSNDYDCSWPSYTKAFGSIFLEKKLLVGRRP